MEAVALRMVDHFVGASGTAFEDATLNDEVRKNPAFAEYWADIEKHRAIGSRFPAPATASRPGTSCSTTGRPSPSSPRSGCRSP
jgi:hypothetical protein